MSRWPVCCDVATPRPAPSADLIELVELAVAQFPADQRPVLVRCDSVGGSSKLVWHRC